MGELSRAWDRLRDAPDDADAEQALAAAIRRAHEDALDEGLEPLRAALYAEGRHVLLGWLDAILTDWRGQ